MARNRRRFRRATGRRRYRKLFVIATEGIKTEPSYFAIFNDRSVVYVRWLRGNHGSSPAQVLQRMEQHLQTHQIAETDEAWLVVDKDQWSDEQLAELHRWSQGADNRGLALSNPRFEYWLLLHFEDGAGISSSQECSRRLRRHLPDYDKSVDHRKFSRDMIVKAVERAKARDSPPCRDWPREPWRTTVYRLVSNILQSQDAPEPS